MHKASDAGHIEPHGMRRCLSFSYRGTRQVPPTPAPEAKKRLIFEECSMCIKHRKYRQKWPLGGASLGQGAEPKKQLNTSCKWIFLGDFLIIFDVAFFDVKNEARAKNHRKYRQKMTPRTRLELQKSAMIFDLSVNILKI